jgi:hypothetical protein
MTLIIGKQEKSTGGRNIMDQNFKETNTEDELQMMYPFAKDLSNEYNARRSNCVEKIRAWHENRQYYYEIVKEYPWEKLYLDK